MQTFLVGSISYTSQSLDNKRLGKQRVEALQILNALEKGPKICCVCRESINYQGRNDCACPTNDGPHNPLKTPWYNHPATRMWKNYKGLLARYGLAMCDEWMKRGFKDNCKHKFIKYLETYSSESYPAWMGDKLYLSHKSNLIRKNASHYRPIFGFDIPNNLPYHWPV